MERPAVEHRVGANALSSESRKHVAEEWLEEGQAEGRVEGRAKAQAELIDGMAFRKFGAVQELVGLLDYLEQIPEPERLVEVGEWIIDHQSVEDLLERLGPLPTGWPSDWEERVTEIRVENEGSSREEGRAKGWSQGWLEGQREVIRRTTARKFGPDTAEELLRRLERTLDPERLTKIGELVITCKYAEELIDRAGKLAEEEPINALARHFVMEGWVDGRAQGWISGRKAGRDEGRVEGRMEVMHQVAERKFGTETADRLAEWLKKLRREDVTNPEPTRVVGEWLFECESGETLLDRVEGLCEPSAPGDGAAPD